MVTREWAVNVDWPEGRAVIDLALNVVHGRIQRVEVDNQLFAQPMIGATRIRLPAKVVQPPGRFTMRVTYEGESPIPDVVRVLDDAPDDFKDAQMRDTAEIVECRRRFASVPGRIGTARSFFLALEKATALSVCPDVRNKIADLQLCLFHRLRKRRAGESKKFAVPYEASALIHGVFTSTSRVYARFEDEAEGYLLFAAGQLEHACPFADVAAGPNSANLFFFAEFAFAACEVLECNASRQYWRDRLPVLVLMQRLFRLRFGQSWPFSSLTPSKMCRVNVLAYDTIEEEKEDLLPKIEKDPAGMCAQFVNDTIASFNFE